MLAEDEHTPAVMVLPCQHTFCSDCHKEKRKNHNKCSDCGKNEKDIIVSTWINELAEEYLRFKKPLSKRLTWIKARMDKDFQLGV